MSNTFTSMFCHCVWSTKNRYKFLESPYDKMVYRFITGIAQNEGSDIISIGGMPDHVHLLILMKPTESIARLVKCMKSGSTKMIRQTSPDLRDFAWQRGYGAFSVSLSQSDVVQKYIQNQKKHHEKRSFEEEFLGLLKRHDVSYDERYLYG